MTKTMRVAVMGSGGVGAYYGGLLARAGHDVTFVARGEHLKAMQDRGLQVKSVHGDFVVKPANVTDELVTVGELDLVLVCVKTPETEAAARAVMPVVGAETMVLSLQNGIDSAERIGAIVGLEHVLGGATWISSFIEEPGVIRQVSQFRRIVFGELDGSMSARGLTLLEALQSTGAKVELTRNIQKVLWTKFVFISSISALGAVTRVEIGEYRDVEQAREMLIRMMREVEAVGRAEGVSLDEDVVEQALAVVDKAVADIKPSMQRDVEAGRRSELESLVAVVVGRGRAHGVPTPVAEMVYAALLPGELKARR
jgi:2-dehydropantoate 2-reductase